MVSQPAGSGGVCSQNFSVISGCLRAGCCSQVVGWALPLSTEVVDVDIISLVVVVVKDVDTSKMLFLMQPPASDGGIRPLLSVPASKD